MTDLPQGTERDGKGLKGMFEAQAPNDTRRAFNAGWNMAGGDHRQEQAYKQFITAREA